MESAFITQLLVQVSVHSAIFQTYTAKTYVSEYSLTQRVGIHKGQGNHFRPIELVIIRPNLHKEQFRVTSNYKSHPPIKEPKQKTLQLQK